MAELEHRLPEEKSMEQELADRFKRQEELTNEMALAFIDELRHMTGLRQPKQDFFRSVTSGELNYYSAKHDEIIVKVSDETATMIGQSKVVAAVYGGGRNTWRIQGDFTLRKEDGVWKLTSSRASTY